MNTKAWGVGKNLNFGRDAELPVILQNEAAECGLACLAMISHYHGFKISMPSLRRRFSVSLKGLNLAGILSMAHSLGLQARAVKLELSEIGQLQLPCIIHWNLNHFVILKSVKKNRVIIHDPAVGKRVISIQEVSERFSGVALELTRGPTFQRKSSEPSFSLRSLAGSVKGLARSVAQIFALALVLELFVLLTPMFTQLVMDQVLADGDRDLLTFLGLSFSVLLLLQIAVTALRAWSVLWLSAHFNVGWTANVFQHLMRLPQSYFLKRHLGDIVSRFSAIEIIQQTLTTKFVEVVLDGFMSIVTLVVMAVYCWPLCLVALLCALLYAGSRILYFGIFRERNLSQIIYTAKQQSTFMEAARGIQTLRLYNQGPLQTARYLNNVTDTINCSVKIQRLGIIFNSVNMFLSGAQRIALLWCGAWLALGAYFSAGMLVAFIVYADQFSQRSSGLIDYLVELRLLRLQGERLSDIVLTPPEAYEEGVYGGPVPQPSISFRGVTFRYSDSEPFVLRDINFHIAPGESVAIIGPSGCGKSTLAKVALGLLDPLVGHIEIGGVNLHHLGKNAYREMVGSVMQDDVLFAGTVADNISFFDPSATPERVEDAAKLAEIHDDIVAMPMGYHTLVGDMGSALSGGQQQRLFLARALYKKPVILVLDEATSHLDVPRERIVSSTLKSLKVTKIFIAHRPDTIATADRVFALQYGELRELTRRPSVVEA